MPPERRESGSASDWLRHAESDLELSRMERPPKVLLEDLCFHTQQAAEKALGSCPAFVLFLYGVREPRSRFDWTKPGFVHALPQAQLGAPKAPAWLAHSKNFPPRTNFRREPTDYAVVSRYPGDLEPVTEEEHQEAIALADAVVRWAESLVKIEIKS